MQVGSAFSILNMSLINKCLNVTNFDSVLPEINKVINDASSLKDEDNSCKAMMIKNTIFYHKSNVKPNLTFLSFLLTRKILDPLPKISNISLTKDQIIATIKNNHKIFSIFKKQDNISLLKSVIILSFFIPHDQFKEIGNNIIEQEYITLVLNILSHYKDLSKSTFKDSICTLLKKLTSIGSENTILWGIVTKNVNNGDIKTQQKKEIQLLESTRINQLKDIWNPDKLLTILSGDKPQTIICSIKPEEKKVLERIKNKTTTKTILSSFQGKSKLKKEESIKVVVQSVFNLSEEIEAIKKTNQIEEIKINELVDTSKVSKDISKNDNTFALGLLSKAINDNGIDCKVIKDKNNLFKDHIDACLHSIISGVAFQEVATVKFDFGTKENEEILTIQSKQEEFKQKWIKEFANASGKDPKTIQVLSITRGSVNVTFSNLNGEDIDKVKTNGKVIKEYKIHPVLSQCLLTPENMDPRGDNKTNWPCQIEKRGREDYYPPYGWIGFGLRVLNTYDNGNNDWLMMDGNPNEWCVAYHGVSDPLKNEILEEEKKKGNIRQDITVIKNIVEQGLKAGPNQFYKNDNDLRHKGKKCGVGIYCSPLITEAKKYTAQENSYFFSFKYQIAFQCRINPYEFRQSNRIPENYVVNPEDIRPYRILIKKYEEKEKSTCYLGHTHSVEGQSIEFRQRLGIWG